MKSINGLLKKVIILRLLVGIPLLIVNNFIIFVKNKKREKTFLIYTHTIKTLRGRAVVARKAHNLEAVGSNPAPATKKD